MKVTCVQLCPRFADVHANINMMAECIDKQNSDLIIFPELSTCGYFFTDRSSLHEHSLHKNSEVFLPLQETAKNNNVNVVFGFAERDGDRLYNSSLLINSHGEIQGVYRKVHLFYYEHELFSSGNLGFETYQILTQENEEVTIGMQICYDWRFPESTRMLALGGAQLVAIPSCIVTTTGMLHDTLRVRAFENKVIIAFADRVGSETNTIDGVEETLHFRGESCIINYNGEILSRLDQESIDAITCIVEPKNTINKDINSYNNILSDRKPESYTR